MLKSLNLSSWIPPSPKLFIGGIEEHKKRCFKSLRKTWEGLNPLIPCPAFFTLSSNCFLTPTPTLFFKSPLLCFTLLFMQEKKLSEDIAKDLSSDLQVTWCFCTLHYLDASVPGTTILEIMGVSPNLLIYHGTAYW